MITFCRHRLHGNKSYREINLSYFEGEEKPFAVYFSDDFRGKKWWYPTFAEAREDYVGTIRYSEKSHGYTIEKVEIGEKV